MKHYSAGIRFAAMICIWSMIFVTGCGANKSQNEITDSLIESNDTETSDKSADASTTPGTDFGISQEEVESESEIAGQEESLITDEATLQIVLNMVENSADQTVLEYVDFTTEEFLEEAAAVYQTAHDNGYVYGDSQTMPPCEDGFISCDRLIARTLWNLGMTDQPAKGMNVGCEAAYLTTHGFEIVTDQSQLSAGDVVMQDNGVSGGPNWKWHTFILVSYDPETTMCEKYDCGHFTPEGKDRISSEQPFVCPLADYGSQRRFVCGFHLKQKPEDS